MVVVKDVPTFLDDYLEIARERYESCLDSIDHGLTVDGIPTKMQFHHLKVDGNGRFKFQALAEILAEHLVNYCLSARARGEPTKLHQHAQLFLKAKQLFRGIDKSGEAGELLLYFLLEAVLGAPQIVAKMDFKTNPQMEVNGSDGIHMKWCAEDECLDVFFGEAKLYSSISQALDSAFLSIESFHKNSIEAHELRMVTSHFKYLKESEKQVIADWVDQTKPGGDCRINHACLIGYDWDKYAKLKNSGKSRLTEFLDAYSQDLVRLKNLLQTRLSNCQLTELHFVVFFLPFESVDAFRKAFAKVIGA